MNSDNDLYTIQPTNQNQAHVALIEKHNSNSNGSILQKAIKENASQHTLQCSSYHKLKDWERELFHIQRQKIGTEEYWQYEVRYVC
ncbi:hypothetical protein DPMN_031831 [Dreissena polymorpha]|uniref:Uncharacterized protein n=1 Tax=Dreissena polymorpha TaxID=45954 RepID=A0A9D4RJP7_DREPO|nr:hypothetical protein DPMN_031831 [Dreissena polymorpha]